MICRCLSRTAMRGSRRCASSGTVTSTALSQGDREWQLRPSAQPVLKRGGAQDDALQLLRRRAYDAQQMVLPRGFPHSVAPGYAGYTGWLAAGLFAHSFTVMVSTNALLSGFFAEMSAASWLMKDLLPPLLAGTLASRIRTLEANPKRCHADRFQPTTTPRTRCRLGLEGHRWAAQVARRRVLRQQPARRLRVLDPAPVAQGEQTHTYLAPACRHRHRLRRDRCMLLPSPPAPPSPPPSPAHAPQHPF